MTTGKPRRRWTRRGFTEAQIAQAAVELLDAQGVDGLTIRALGQALGVAPNAVYTYVASRRELERLTVEHVLRGVVDTAGDEPPRAAVTALCRAAHQALRRHPGAARLLMTAPMDGPVARGLHEQLLWHLVAAGLPVAEAARAAYLLITYVTGTAALADAELAPGAPPPTEDAWVQARAAAVAEIDSAAWPLTAASAEVMARWVGAEQFDWGLARLLDGVLPG